MPPSRRGPYLRSVAVAATAPESGYPFELPAVRGLDVPLGALTVLVGDNGSGKSTLVEAIAVRAGFNAEGGGRNLRFETMSTHSDLHRHLTLRWGQRPSWGWFLRAETFYGMASHIAADDHPKTGIADMFPDLHGRSHGESFITLITNRLAPRGLYLLDEPESALSFQGQLQLLRFIHDAVGSGSQFILATHSPVLMRAEGATILELDADGIREKAYDDVTSVGLWRSFLNAPERMLDVLYADDHHDLDGRAGGDR